MEKERRSKWSVFMLGVLLIVGVMCSVVPVKADTSADAFQIYYQGNGQENTGIIIHRYKGTESNVIIPSTIEGLPVVQIDKEAFKGCDQVVSVTIPDSVTGIRDSAFEGCSSLKEIALPDSVDWIGESVFRKCTSLQKIAVPSYITNEMFAGCSNLKEVSISAKMVRLIAYNAFYGCVNLETLTVDAENKGYYSEGNCIIKRDNKELVLGCKNSVIPEDVEWIDYKAFYGCNGMKEVNIPQNVSSISEGAFYACQDLETLTVADGNKRYYSEGNCIITKDSKELVLGCKQSVIPEDVVTIGASAFANCSKLSSVHIPKSVTQIATGNIFKGCDSLTEVTVDQDNPIYYVEKNCLITKKEHMLILGWKGAEISEEVEAVEQEAFYGCTGLTEITLPEHINWLSHYNTFSGCTNLKTVNVESGVMVLPSFTDCSKLENIEIPDTVIEIGGFAGCSSLKSINIPGSVRKLGSFAGCTSLKEITIPSSVTTISSFMDCTSLKSIVIPDTVTTIESSIGTFKGCTNLEAVTLPKNVTSIMANQFKDCTKLTTVKIPSGVEKIEPSAFSGCSSLKNITIPEKVSTIGGYAFYGCGLESVKIPEGVEYVGGWAFSDCKNLKKVVLSGHARYDWYIFVSCDNLSEVEVPDNADTSFGYSMFSGCSKLTEIAIPESVTKITDDAFSGSGLTTVYAKTGSYAATWAAQQGYKVIDKDAPAPTPDQPSVPDQTPTQTPSGATPAQTGQNTAKLPSAKGTILTAPEWQWQVRVISDAAADPTVEYLVTTNKKAATIKVPDSVTVDGITYKVTAIAGKALAGNKKVKKVVLGVNVTSIGKNAFANCKNLKKIEVKSSQWNKKSVGKNAFKGTSKKLVVKVPKKMASTYKKYIKGKGNKTVRVK